MCVLVINVNKDFINSETCGGKPLLHYYFMNIKFKCEKVLSSIMQ